MTKPFAPPDGYVSPQELMEHRKFAYADPPYLGQGKRRYGKLHSEAVVYDTIDGHKKLVERLVDEYPDGWAMSLSSPSLRAILPLCPSDVRVMAWAKPFAVFKPGVGLAYTWEPVIIRGGRKITRQERTIKDHLIESITLKKGLCGAKPLRFCTWVLAALNVKSGDSLDDIFPGTAIMGEAFKAAVDEAQKEARLSTG